MANSIAGRMDFDIAYRIFKNAFKDAWALKNKANPNDFDPATEFRLTQSRLRLEQPIVTTSTLYTFPVLVNIQNQAQQFNTEIRLNQQDSFVPTYIGIYVAAPGTTTDAAFELKSYFNPFTFGAANAAAGNTLYNGTKKIMINNVQYINNWPVVWHKNVPETQQTAAVGVGSPLDQFVGDCYGLKDMQPYVLLVGSQNIVINIVLPLAITAALANSRIIVVYDGILAQNSTVVG